MHREYYDSPIGGLFLEFDADALTALGFAGASVRADYPENPGTRSRISHDTRRWLDIYFAGVVPDFTPRLNAVGTPFQKRVWQLLSEIPYGKSVTYGEIAARISRKDKRKMSAQAVGGAVGANPISIIVPCHRVLGKGGIFTGYEWGINAKKALLDLEGIAYKE